MLKPSCYSILVEILLLSGLICLHKETWDISVLQAFVQTLFPDMAQLFWDQEEATSS